MAPTVMERCGEGLRVETPKGPFCQEALEGRGHKGGVGLLRGYWSEVYNRETKAPGG